MEEVVGGASLLGFDEDGLLVDKSPCADDYKVLYMKMAHRRPQLETSFRRCPGYYGQNICPEYADTCDACWKGFVDGDAVYCFVGFEDPAPSFSYFCERCVWGGKEIGRLACCQYHLTYHPLPAE